MKKLVAILAIILVFLLLLLAGLTIIENRHEKAAQVFSAQLPEQTTLPTTAPATAPTTAPTTQPVETTPPTTEPPPTEPPFEVGCTPDSDPANWNVDWDVIVGDEIVESFQREEEIFFEEDYNYFALPGISTFRGGNDRRDASFGIADITDGSISQIWSMHVGAAADAGWFGCGWTGQPLVVQWDDQTKAIMNLYEDKKAKEDLVEVIYAKMDGYVHFIDLEDGSYTRDPIYVGMVFKGSGAIDPRGYPLLYLGSGIQSGGKTQTMFIVSLIDGSILFEHSGYDSLTNRYWFGFDGAPLIDGETDTLIWGGESGLLYTIKLNTVYDRKAGTISVSPDPDVKSRYSHNYSRQGRYLGYEASVTGVENYLFVGDNAGILQCIDTNTMDLIWAQDFTDDINCTAAFDWGKDHNGYLYVSPSTDYSGGNLPICKVDAQTGEILWTYTLTCYNVDGVPGGTLSSPLLGRDGSDIEDLVIFSVGRTPSTWSGRMIAFDKDTGDIVWEYQTGNYMWSSPVALYTEDGKGYVFQADASGNCYLLDGATGEVLNTVCLNSTVEASPVVFNDTVVIGTRSSMHLLRIS